MIRRILNLLMRSSGSMHKIWFVFRKDLLQEFNTRYAFNSILLFALITLTAVSFAIGTFSAGSEVKAALLWIILFFSSMSGLSHIFVKEEETHTADTLKLLAQPYQVFAGKLLFNFFLLVVLEIIIIPLFFILMNFEVTSLFMFFLVLLSGTIGLAGGGTMVAAIVSKASAKGALFTVLSFPILLPILIVGIDATKSVLRAGNSEGIYLSLQTLFAFGMVINTVSFLLFDFVWKE